MTSDSLRKLAAELREVARQSEQEKMVKCAQTLKAATALTLLRKKVHAHVR